MRIGEYLLYSMISLTQQRNINGPKLLPYGIPDFTYEIRIQKTGNIGFYSIGKRLANG